MTKQDKQEAEAVINGLSGPLPLYFAADAGPSDRVAPWTRHNIDERRWKLVIQAVSDIAQSRIDGATAIEYVGYYASLVSRHAKCAKNCIKFVIMQAPAYAGFDPRTSEDQVTICLQCGFTAVVTI